MEAIKSTAASSVNRNGSCRKSKVAKNTVIKRSMKTKTVSHLQNEVAKKLGYNKLSKSLIELLKSTLEKSKYTGFAVLFFDDKQTSTMREVIQLMHSRWGEVLKNAHEGIPDEKKCFLTSIVTPYYCNKTKQMHLYFMYSEMNYETLCSRLSNAIENMILK